MNFTYLPSMEHMALVKIVQLLWNQDDIRDEIVWYIKYCLGRAIEEIDKWSKIELKIREKVSQLPMPESLKKEITGYIKPIGHFIKNWIRMIYLILRCELGDIHAILPNSFRWTPQGTIDQRKMAEILIKDNRLQFTTRYTLACNFCLEADIPMLRDKIPEYCIMDYAEEVPSDMDDADLEVVWNYDLARDVANETRRSWPTRYRNAFESAAVRGNKAATEYLLRKLTHEEREECLIRVAFDVVEDDCLFAYDIFGFLLSQMTEEQQMKVFQEIPYALESFLEWPWQDLFLETAFRVMHIFEAGIHSFMGILQEFTREKVGWTDCNYQMLLGEFWKQSPNVCKRVILNDRVGFGSLLEDLLRNEDRKNIELILKGAALEQKKKYSPDTSFISSILRKVNDWDLLKLFIEEFVSSEKLAFKFVEILNEDEVKKSFEGREDLWNKLSQLLNGLTHKVDRKRSMEEASDNPTKKLCSTVTQ